LLQNKAAKIILNRSLYSSATDALVTLTEQRGDVHDCNTRNRDMLRLSLSTKNWGNRVCYHYLKDWNNLD
ncbi:unnamed protein product, partial [Porites evermanni]